MIAAIFFAAGLASLALFTWEGYAILAKRTTISRWMANLLHTRLAAFVAVEFVGAAVYVLLLLHFVGALPFWSP